MTSLNIPDNARCEFNGIEYVHVLRTEREQMTSSFKAFAIFDNKGREFGYRYTVDREVNRIDAGASTIIPIDELGDYLGETYVVHPHAMRDGIAFGATPVRSRKRFRTMTDAVAYGEKLAAAARKKAEKQAAG